jgi:uncharacterized protein
MINPPRNSDSLESEYINEVVILIVPGLNNSDEFHWQTLWEKSSPNFIRVQQENWNTPVCSDWVNNIEKTVFKYSRKKIFIVAHSLGCLATVHWAGKTNQKIAGALIVAPPDIENPLLKGIIKGFGPIPNRPLPFNSLLVASSDDEYIDIEKASLYSKYWGSRFINVGSKGHINTKSGIGVWGQGLHFLFSLINSDTKFHKKHHYVPVTAK